MAKKTDQNNEPDLFSSEESRDNAQGSNPNRIDKSQQKRPLAYRCRPQEREDYAGAQELYQRYPFLKGQDLPSLIIHGPPGSGKTTLAQVLCHEKNLDLTLFNAVLGGVADLKKVIERALESQKFYGKRAVIFIDEIHRFNKAQQDALLPYVESGDFIFIGATTENPKVSVNRALVSRVKLVALNKLTEGSLEKILYRASKSENRIFSDEVYHTLSRLSDGDARTALNALETLLETSIEEPTHEDILKAIGGPMRQYDKNKDRHYDVISAFIKSLRGSDPDSAILYLAIMLDGGEDPKFIARRLLVFASEDVGNADPQALTLAASALTAVDNIGMPEARINLAQVTTYLASTVKSNASYMAINEALSFVRGKTTIEVPTHLRNHHPDKANYKYPHSYDNAFVKQQYRDTSVPRFYYPKDIGTEKKIKLRLAELWNFKD